MARKSKLEVAIGAHAIFLESLEKILRFCGGTYSLCDEVYTVVPRDTDGYVKLYETVRDAGRLGRGGPITSGSRATFFITGLLYVVRVAHPEG